MFYNNFRKNEDELREREIDRKIDNLYSMFICFVICAIIHKRHCDHGRKRGRKSCCSIQCQTNGSLPHSHFSVAGLCWLFVFNITQWLIFQLFVKQWLHSLILYRLITPREQWENGQPDGKKYIKCNGFWRRIMPFCFYALLKSFQQWTTE